MRKKERHRLFKFLIKRGWPWRVAGYYSKHLCTPTDYKYIDNLDLNYCQTYYCEKTKTMVYIDHDYNWIEILVTKPLSYYYD